MNFERHLHAIIDSFVDKRPPEVIAEDPYHERGTFLGSEISQITQLAVPSHIDHAVKEKFRIKEYIRYNDDMLFIHEDPEVLRSVREYVAKEFSKLGLTVVDKSGIQPLKNRIRFMKKTFILRAGGRVIVLIDSKKISEERRRLRKLKAKVDSGQTTMEKVRDHYQSFIASVSRCDSEAAVRHLDRFYESVFGEKPVYKRGKDNAYSKCKRANQKKRRNGSQRGGKSHHAGRLPVVHVHDDRH